MNRVTRFAVIGAAMGTLFAVSVPPERAVAEEQQGCVCNDAGNGTYQCNATQTSCIAGTEKGVLSCQ